MEPQAPAVDPPLDEKGADAMDVVKTTVDAPGEEQINLRVCDQSGTEIFFKLKATTMFQKLFDAYAQRQGLNPASIRFLVDGSRIKGTDTPKSREMEDNDIIDCLTMQTGGILFIIKE